MRTRAIILVCTLLIAAPLLARDKSDVIVMKNGDRMTCEIKGLDSGVLYASLDYVDGTISVQWSKVARLESSQLFLVKTQDGSVYTGTLRTPETTEGRPVEIAVAQAPTQEVVLDRQQIVRMGETSKKFWQRFNGEIDWGLLYSKGNQSTQYNLSSEVEYPRERWLATANYSSNLSSSTGTNASTRNELTVGAQRLLRWNNYFYAGIADFLQSSVQGIQLQTSLGGGIGRYLKNTNNATVAVVGGFAWQGAQYRQAGSPDSRDDVAAGLVGVQAKFFRFKKTNLDLTAEVFPAISEPGRVHLNLNTAYYIKIFSNLSWNISFYGNWDNQPPPHFSGSDYGSSSGVTWTFGDR